MYMIYYFPYFQALRKFLNCGIVENSNFNGNHPTLVYSFCCLPYNYTVAVQILYSELYSEMQFQEKSKQRLKCIALSSSPNEIGPKNIKKQNILKRKSSKTPGFYQFCIRQFMRFSFLGLIIVPLLSFYIKWRLQGIMG